MTNEEYAELIYKLVCWIVDKPEQVEVNIRVGEKTDSFDISVAKEDLGRVLGKNGRNINSIRTLVQTSAWNSKKYINITVIQ